MENNPLPSEYAHPPTHPPTHPPSPTHPPTPQKHTNETPIVEHHGPCFGRIDVLRPVSTKTSSTSDLLGPRGGPGVLAAATRDGGAGSESARRAVRAGPERWCYSRQKPKGSRQVLQIISDLKMRGMTVSQMYSL